MNGGKEINLIIEFILNPLLLFASPPTAAANGSMVIMLFEKGRLNSLTVQQGQQIGIFSQQIK